MKKYVNYYICSLVVLFFIGFIHAQDTGCTTDDYTYSYTECTHNRTRNLIYYWKDGINCTGGVALPANIFNLACDIPCGEGEYLPPGGRECDKCSPGTFSIGGGERVSDWTNNWGYHFQWTTYCMNATNSYLNPSSGCAGWYAGQGGLFIFSGNTSDNQRSILSVPILLITDGHVHFEYRVDAEPRYDKLIFDIDGEILITESSTQDYVTFFTNLTKGFYTLTWTFSKDYSVSQGEDAAFIRMFEVGGIQYASSQCTLCPKGQYVSYGGAESCFECPPNTYTNQTGSIICGVCPSQQYSYAGSVSCTDRLPCTANDYAAAYTPCQGSTRTKYYVWLEPTICDNTTYTLPASSTVSCEQCNAGTFRDPSTSRCIPCGDGKASGLGSTCQTCSGGTAAVKGYYWQRWSEWPAELTTGCAGDCGSNGFRASNDSIDSGYGHGSFVDVFLNTNITLDNAVGQVSFSFTIDCDQQCHLDYDDAGFTSQTYTFGNKRVVTLPLQYLSDDEIDGGTSHSLSWVFHKTDPNGLGRNDKVIIHWIKIVGTTTGGAAQCTPCTSGTFATTGSTVCTKCDPDRKSVV